MAKQIQPVTIWVNGESKTAEFLDAYAVRVSLGSSANFHWSLHEKQTIDGVDSAGAELAKGNAEMSGADYQAWDDDDIAWEYIAGKINLTIV